MKLVNIVKNVVEMAKDQKIANDAIKDLGNPDVLIRQFEDQKVASISPALVKGYINSKLNRNEHGVVLK